jgi:peroxiredoxin
MYNVNKLRKGAQAPPINEVSVTGNLVRIPDPDVRSTHLQFRRFAGCPICNLHLMEIGRRMAEFKAENIREVVVFHSSKEELLEHQSLLKFECIADPGKLLYRKFGVETSVFSLLHPAALLAALRAVLTTMRIPKQTENGALGLPADFLIGPTGRIEAVHYGAHAYDNWDADTILRLTRNAHD